MISRAHRFHGYSSLRFVYKGGRTERGSLISLRYTENPRRKTWRAAVVVSRKVSKSAVVRNRIRRRIYEQVRLNKELVPGVFDLVFTVFSPQVDELSPEQISKQIKAIMKRAFSKPSQQAPHAIVKTKEK